MIKSKDLLEGADVALEQRFPEVTSLRSQQRIVRKTLVEKTRLGKLLLDGFEQGTFDRFDLAGKGQKPRRFGPGPVMYSHTSAKMFASVSLDSNVVHPFGLRGRKVAFELPTEKRSLLLQGHRKIAPTSVFDGLMKMRMVSKLNSTLLNDFPKKVPEFRSIASLQQAFK